MRILLLGPGTRGDVAPVTGLGAAFVADGHEVTIVANVEYAHLVTGAGCAHVPIDAPVTPKSGGMRAYLATLRTYMDVAATAALGAATGAEVVVTNAISPYGHDIAEALAVLERAARSLASEAPIEQTYAELAEAADYAAHLETIKQRLNRVRSPFRSAEHFEIEEIIDPRDTRAVLCEFAELVAPLRRAGPVAFGYRP